MPIENLRLGFQLFAHELGPIGNYRLQLDWYYLDYRVADWLAIRAGRTKLPFGLYNEINDIDVARVPILLPQSIYPVDHREFLYAQTGGELYGDIRLGPVGALEYRAYGGTLQAVFESLALLPAGLTYPTRIKFRVTRWVASLEYAADDWDVSAEYSRWIGEFYSPAPLLLPPHTVNERYFAMASYRVNAWFSPGLYYSAYFENVKQRDEQGAYQRDVALTTRFDVNAHWLVKLEGHLIRGTAALDNRALNGGAERETLEQAWGMFLIKTTAYF